MHRILTFLKELSVNLLLAIGSLVFCSLILAFIVFPLALPHMSLAHQAFLPEGARIFAQSSKTGLIPKNYIGLVGDSYAQGLGDWLLTNDDEQNGPYNSANVIHELTKRDVVTFGVRGAGSLRGIASQPVAQFLWLDAQLLPMPTAPQELVIYFYEGNDLQDNIIDLKMRLADRFDYSRLYDTEYFDEFLSSAVLPLNPLMNELQESPWVARIPFYGYLKNMSVAFAKQLNSQKEEINISTVSGESPTLARVAKRFVSLPEKIQGPPTELSLEEIEQGLYIFERSLHFLARKSPRSKITIVYVPSPISCYEIVSEEISQLVYLGDWRLFSRQEVEQRHQLLRGRVAEIAEKMALGFIDASDDLRSTALQAFVHGPKDWKHFNETGQRALGKRVSEGLRATASEER